MGTTREGSQIKSYSLSGLYRYKQRATQENKNFGRWQYRSLWDKKSSHENVCNATKCSRALAATSVVGMTRFENRLSSSSRHASRSEFHEFSRGEILNYVRLSNTYGSYFVALLNKVRLLRRTHHRFIFYCALCVCYMSGPFLRPSSDMSIQRSLKRKIHWNEI
jgi:hypothetical protein